MTIDHVPLCIMKQFVCGRSIKTINSIRSISADRHPRSAAECFYCSPHSLHQWKKRLMDDKSSYRYRSAPQTPPASCCSHNYRAFIIILDLSWTLRNVQFFPCVYFPCLFIALYKRLQWPGSVYEGLTSAWRSCRRPGCSGPDVSGILPPAPRTWGICRAHERGDGEGAGGDYGCDCDGSGDEKPACATL